ncbi:four helix bundle protein [candidate division KSB1 bacterium]|nr:four helix bundle protein [candidate division KSB1 bacterium]
MATYHTFTELDIWKKARDLNKQIYALSANGLFAKDFCLQKQIRRASISIMSNIAEGFERDGNKEFLQYLSVSKGSLGEVMSQLYIAFDLTYIDKQSLNDLMDMSKELSKRIGGFMKYLKQTPLKGNKYK